MIPTIKSSITLRMSLWVASLLRVLCLFIYIYIPATLDKTSKQIVIDEANTLGRMVSQAASPAVVFEDTIAINESLSLFNRVPEITYARIVSNMSDHTVSYHIQGKFNADST